MNLYFTSNQVLLCILFDFPIHMDTISLGLPIVYVKGSHVKFSKL